MRVISLIILACAGVASSVQAQPDLLLTGLRQFRDGDLPAAESSFRKALAVKEDIIARAFLALTEAGTGRCEQAVPELGKLLSGGADPDVRRLAGLALAECQVNAGRFDDALASTIRMKAMYPSDPDVLYQAARLYMEAWNATVREMFEKTPASFRVNQLSAGIFETESKYDAAVSEYRKALAKSPKTIGLHFRLGRALLMQSHEPAALNEARKEFEAELALNPFDAPAQYEIAQIFLAQQKPDEAAPRLQRALDLTPDFPEALIALAKIKTERGQSGEAIPLLERAVRLAPRSQGAHLGLMLAYRNAGRMEDAQAQKDELDKLLKPPEGEFSQFLKKLGERNP